VSNSVRVRSYNYSIAPPASLFNLAKLGRATGMGVPLRVLAESVGKIGYADVVQVGRGW